MAKSSTPILRGESPRIAIRQTGKLVGPDGEVGVDLVDVSLEGFRVRAEQTIAGNETILRTSKSGDSEIEIKWIRGDEAGGVFRGAPPKID